MLPLPLDEEELLCVGTLDDEDELELLLDELPDASLDCAKFAAELPTL